MKRRRDFFEITYTNPGYRIGLHLLFWLLMLGSYYYFNTISFTAARGTPATYLLAVHNAVTIAAAFYGLMYFIWPRFLAKRKWMLSVFWLLVWITAIGILTSLGDRLIFTRCQPCGRQLALLSPDYYNFLHRNFFDIVFVRVVTGGLLYQLVIQLSFPVALKIGRSHFRQTVKQLQLAKDNLQLEFNFLKSQVNPHFLFNTLNNVYSLVMAERNEQAGATLACLSGFMRYALYETGDEAVPLNKEAELLRDYVELEKLRLNETDVVFRYESDNEAYTVPPLLLMPAVENAFKYSVDEKGSCLVVDIHAANAVLNVSIQNNFDPQKAQRPGGIGLQNLRRRLKHTYNDKGRYSTTTVNDVYLFRLSCPLA